MIFLPFLRKKSFLDLTLFAHCQENSGGGGDEKQCPLCHPPPEHTPTVLWGSQCISGHSGYRKPKTRIDYVLRRKITLTSQVRGFQTGLRIRMEFIRFQMMTLEKSGFEWDPWKMDPGSRPNIIQCLLCCFTGLRCLLHRAVLPASQGCAAFFTGLRCLPHRDVLPASHCCAACLTELRCLLHRAALPDLQGCAAWFTVPETFEWNPVNSIFGKILHSN